MVDHHHCRAAQFLLLAYTAPATRVADAATKALQVKRLLTVASVSHILFLSQLCEAYAAGRYDGEWTGSATSTGGRCKPAIVTLIVEGKVVTGQARFERDAANVNGTVWEDGTFGATIGFQHLTGKFIEGEFEGTFESFGCVWNMLLKRTK
jgi:hypothetical protein